MGEHTRWMVETKSLSVDNELLQVVQVYAPNEKRKVAQRENRHLTHEVHEIKVDSSTTPKRMSKVS